MSKKTFMALIIISALIVSLNSLLAKGQSMPESLNFQVQAINVESPANNGAYTDSVPLNVSLAHLEYEGPPFHMGTTLIYANYLVVYSLDGQANVTVPSNNTLTGLPNGSHTIKFYQSLSFYNDYYHGGTGFHYYGVAYSTTVYFTFLNSPLNISAVSLENKTFTTNIILLNFTVNRPISSASYNLDKQGNTTIQGNTSLTVTTDGLHSLVIYANDTIGNDGSSSTIFFKVNTQPSPLLSPSPTSAHNLSSSPSESPTPQPTAEPSRTPDRPQIGDFAPVIIPASMILLAIIVVGLLVYFRRRRG